MARKQRLDDLLVDLGYFAEASQALGPIMAGDVVVAGVRLTKAGSRVPVDAEVSVRGRNLRYASRGGYKLERALAAFDIDVTGMTVLDAGAATGGFTDCLLQHGAARVYSVDVGYGQLRGRIAADDRVVVRERTNISDLLATPPDETIDLCVMDLSYLSLEKAVPIVRTAIGDVELVCLVKPLYEGLAEVRKADIPAILELAGRLIPDLAAAGFSCVDVVGSPVQGGRGAVEFLIRVGKADAALPDVPLLVEKLRADWLEHPPAEAS